MKGIGSNTVRTATFVCLLAPAVSVKPSHALHSHRTYLNTTLAKISEHGLYNHVDFDLGEGGRDPRGGGIETKIISNSENL